MIGNVGEGEQIYDSPTGFGGNNPGLAAKNSSGPRAGVSVSLNMARIAAHIKGSVY